jgi:atypical dual specificity phosphatase
MGGEWPLSHLDWLRARGISVLVNLTERTYRDDRFRIHQIPVPDGTAPGEQQIGRFCGLVRRALEDGTAVYAHCHAGCGRTGTVMACYLVYADRMDAKAAIERVRGLRPCSIETDAQMNAVTEWAGRMRQSGYRLPVT